MRATVRYDDQCGNGHNSFSITGEYTYPDQSWENGGGGCIHDEIAAAFPELTPFIKWHLVSSDGPMHYIANTTYHASDKDHRGLRKSERKQLVNGKTNLPVWELVVRDSKNEKAKSVSSSSWVGSDECPTSTFSAKWEPVWIEGEGKESDLEAARSCAVWPDATLEQLQDAEALSARLPALMEAFRADVKSLGFVY